ncbi:membrane hypothetical protein [Frankia sp. AiPs1]
MWRLRWLARLWPATGWRVAALLRVLIRRVLVLLVVVSPARVTGWLLVVTSGLVRPAATTGVTAAALLPATRLTGLTGLSPVLLVRRALLVPVLLVGAGLSPVLLVGAGLVPALLIGAGLCRAGLACAARLAPSGTACPWLRPALSRAGLGSGAPLPGGGRRGLRAAGHLRR